MKTFDVADLEEAAAESEQDRRDHRALTGRVAELLKHDDAMRVPVAVKRLVDGGIDPVVVAKTLLIGDRDGGPAYTLSSRAAALGHEEQAAALWIGLALRDCEPDLGATVAIAGAVWLATQFTLSRELLADLVINAARRPRHPERLGYGAVDLIDNHGVGDRNQVVESVRLATLPLFAPLEYRPS